jgi:hypothetical protein
VAVVVDAPSASATLSATLPGPTPAGAVYFEWGEGQSYSHTTASLAIVAGLGATTVSTPVSSLKVGPEYRYRAVEVTGAGSVTSSVGRFSLISETQETTTDTTTVPTTEISTLPVPTVPVPTVPVATATTPKSPTSNSGSSKGTSSSGDSGSSGNDSSHDTPATPTPRLGKSVVVEVATGTVTVKKPGGAAAPLDAQTTIPVGSMVDATKGVVSLTAVRNTGGGRNTGTFWGGRFTIRHPTGHPGMTELVLHDKPSCPSTRQARAATARRGRPVELWGHDNHGRFRTRGRNSVATVRGTTWYTADTCAGTVTGVVAGSVAVRDLHSGRVTVLHATPPPRPNR